MNTLIPLTQDPTVPYHIDPVKGNPNGPFIDIMVDLETLGTKPGCKILSIGAVVFNQEAEDFDEPAKFYSSVSIHDQGILEADPSTIEWWGRQSTEAYTAAFSGINPLQNVLREFNCWLEMRSNWGKNVVRIWGKGKDFDAPILRAAYSAMNMNYNWDEDFEMCFRRMYSDMSRVIPKPVFAGEKHNALADAMHQAEHADKIIEYLKEQDIYEEKMQEYKWPLNYGG